MATTVRNTTKGIRGLNTLAGYRDLAPGELAEDVELSDVERKNAESTGYFEFGKAAKAAPEPEQADALPRNAPKLKALAKAEGIDVGSATKVDDLVAAIEAGRTAKAAGGITPPVPPVDDLDAMSDADLLVTVEAITGKAPPEGATREELLAAARAPAA